MGALNIIKHLIMLR